MSGTDIRPAELEISRSNVAVTAKGFVTSFHQGSRFEYEAGEATLIESEVTGMKGEAEITWAATQVKDPRDSIVEKLKLPLSVPFPIQVGPVPMTMTFKAEVRIVPAFEHRERLVGRQLQAQLRQRSRVLRGPGRQHLAGFADQGLPRVPRLE